MLSESMLGAHSSTRNNELRITPPPLLPSGGYLKLSKKLSSLGSRNRFDVQSTSGLIINYSSSPRLRCKKKSTSWLSPEHESLVSARTHFLRADVQVHVTRCKVGILLQGRWRSQRRESPPRGEEEKSGQSSELGLQCRGAKGHVRSASGPPGAAKLEALHRTATGLPGAAASEPLPVGGPLPQPEGGQMVSCISKTVRSREREKYRYSGPKQSHVRPVGEARVRGELRSSVLSCWSGGRRYRLIEWIDGWH
ncbi:hypothetical protein CRG98_002027 [Punica granatum]|uniref:Uncharacterized protein n=1 Tax=Punica granatum TaxID=22663 RepID=A0A2I0LA62_PUNGR|nr:hypothetical protein CRG98_002027 [Punica granatum]